MSFALNEVEAMARKAARGAGHELGMAEEAGRTARWLCGHGLDGVAALVRALQTADGARLAARAPGWLGGDWQAESGEMCPLMAGATLSDSARIWSTDGKKIISVVSPVLLLPFAAMAARTLGRALTVEWEGVLAVTDGEASSLRARDGACLLETAKAVLVHAGGTVTAPLPTVHRATPAPEDWERLTAWAQRTYAPDTEESRLKGAGAGLRDND